MAVDVVVVGSGGAGLAAALAAALGGAKVAVIERAPTVGGTTAISGGGMWIPGNPFMVEQGKPDDPDEVVRYLQTLTFGRVPRSVHEAYYTEAGRLVDFLREHTEVELEGTDTPDYQNILAGSRPGGRQVAVGLFDSARLGALKDLVREPPRPGGTSPIRHGEQQAGGWEVGQHGRDWVSIVADRVARGVFGRGRALVGSLLEASARHGVELILDTRVIRLRSDSTGRIDGVVAVHNGQERTIAARRGVVLASGGFEWNARMVADLLGAPLEAPLSPPGNEGDGLWMAARAGARLANLNSAWWVPSMAVPGDTYDGQPRYRIAQLDKSLPGAIVVNGAGRRYGNECMNYPDFGKLQTRFDPHAYHYPNTPSWVVFDEAHLNRYPVLHRDATTRADASWLTEGATLSELAGRIGVDATGLADQVATFNGAAERGEDPVFHRGEQPWDTYRGDREAAHPNLRPLAGKGPYFAYRLLVGCFGTNGGPVINERAEVLDHTGRALPGLWAAGNVVASIFGTAYPGGGGTLGPALTFGYVAGRGVAEQS